MKVSLILRSTLVGFGVSSIGIGIWLISATYMPMPWSVVAMAAILVIYWMYFSGRWKPKSTQAFRNTCIRQNSLKKTVWVWGLVAAFSIIVLLHWGFSLTFRFYEFQPEVFKTSSYLNDQPAWMSWPIIIMGSMVAGICEEIGYRGYMQKPLEQKYGPIAGISITSVIFVVIHLHQAWASGILVGIFAISFIIGLLAYATNSLLPGIIAHVSFDIVNFSYWWSDVAGTFEHKPISVTGMDNHFIITVMVILIAIIAFTVAILKLLRIKNGGSIGLNLQPSVPSVNSTWQNLKTGLSQESWRNVGNRPFARKAS